MGGVGRSGRREASIGVAANGHPGKEPGATIVLRAEDIEHERKRLESHGVSFEGKIEEIPGAVKLATFETPRATVCSFARC